MYNAPNIIQVDLPPGVAVQKIVVLKLAQA